MLCQTFTFRREKKPGWSQGADLTTRLRYRQYPGRGISVFCDIPNLKNRVSGHTLTVN